MKLISKKILVLVLCIPTYPLVIFAKWYDYRTHFYSRKFSLKRANKEYWQDVKDALIYRKEE